MVDRESGVEFEIRARTVVAATGVWSDDMAEAAGIPAPFTVRASKGIHLVVPREKIDLDTGLILRTEKSVLFVIPWGRHWIVGTTDTEWDLDREHPAASRADVDYVLEHLNAVLRTPVTHDDIEGVYAGLRPLLAAKAAATTKLSREHAVAHPVPGLVIVAGGKYTTYRVMASDTVDVVVEELGRPAPPSWTDRLPIVGAEGYHELWADRFSVASKTGLPLPRVEHLLQRYGTRIWNLVELIKEQPSLGEPITDTSEYLRVEAVYAVSHEGALHLEDVLTRRTRISIEERDRGVTAAPVVAALMAPLLGWDAHRADRGGGELPRAGRGGALGAGGPGRRGGQRHPPRGPGAPAQLTQPIAAAAREHPGTDLTGEEQGCSEVFSRRRRWLSVLTAVPASADEVPGPVDLGTLPGGLTSCGHRVTYHGTVFGEAYDAAFHQHAARWDAAGRISELRPLDRLRHGDGRGDQRSRGGDRELDGHRARRAGHALGRFRRARGLPLLPGFPYHPSTEAAAINDHGVTAGFAYGAPGPDTAVRWETDGTVTGSASAGSGR